MRRPTCKACRWLDADEIERRVWDRLTAFLSDPDRLKATARDYLAIEGGRVVTQEAELETLKNAIALREGQLAAAYAASIKANLDPEAMAMATQQLADELATMKERAAAIGRYRLDVAAQTRAMDRVAELALKLAVRMPGMNGHQQAGVLKILGARVVLLDNSRHPEFYIDGVAAGQRLYSAVAAPDGYPSAPARPRDASATTSDGDRSSIQA